MYLSRLHHLASNRMLTVAQCVELLMDQPTADEASHAQMHLNDRFASDASKIKGSLDAVGRATTWQTGDMHLSPAGYTPLTTYAPADIAKLLDDPQHKDKIFVDATRLPLSAKYKKRTGLPEIPAEAAVTQKQTLAFSQPGGKGAPKKMEYRPDNGGEVLDAGVWKAAGPFGLMPKAKGSADLKLETKDIVIVPGKPLVPESPPHSMFEDSETMAMLLAAVLLSDAGVYMLDHLRKRTTLPPQNVAVYSNSAVAAVRAKFATVSQKATAAGKPLQGAAAQPLGFIERTAKVDPTDPRVILADANRLPKDIKHVVLVADVLADRQFKITTFYPSEQTTAQACGAPTRAWEDLVEMEKGQYRLQTQPAHRAIPLNW
jgi:hypothetical protein